MPLSGSYVSLKINTLRWSGEVRLTALMLITSGTASDGATNNDLAL